MSPWYARRSRQQMALSFSSALALKSVPIEAAGHGFHKLVLLGPDEKTARFLQRAAHHLTTG